MNKIPHQIADTDNARSVGRVHMQAASLLGQPRELRGVSLPSAPAAAGDMHLVHLRYPRSGERETPPLGDQVDKWLPVLAVLLRVGRSEEHTSELQSPANLVC